MAVTRRSAPPPSAGRWTAEVSSILRRSSTNELGYITRGGVGPVGARARKSARTHARGWCGGAGGPPPPFPPHPPTRHVCDVGLPDERARVARDDAPRHRARHIARVHAGAQADVPVVADVGSCCFAPRTRELHGRRRRRCGMCARAWNSAASCAWPLGVGPPASVRLARRACCRLLRVLNAPCRGKTTKRPPKPPNCHPNHQQPPQARQRGPWRQTHGRLNFGVKR